MTSERRKAANREYAAANWEECEQKLLQIEKDNKKSLTGVRFRGVSNAEWCLTTTLERRRAQSLSVAEYYQLMLRVKPEVQTFTGSTWEIPDWSEPENFVEYFRKMSAYGYMAYLRHHGFPSPLLDWSSSPYIAAYFAFAKAQVKQVNDVAIYVFSETPNNLKLVDRKGPKICIHGGANLTTHHRHFRQKSSYTVCVKFCDSENRWKFVSHQRVFDLEQTDQDLLYKITVPSTERVKVLGLLDRFNLNEFSLFGSEESVMEMMAFREIDLKPLTQ